MTTKYYALLTNLGAAKLANAAALGTKLQITHMAVGDGGGTLPTPNASQTALVGEKRRAALNSLSIDAANSSQIIAEQVIPEAEGGFWIREIGLFDADGVMIAVANCAETYKPQLQEGSGRTQTVRMIIIVNSADAVTLKIDPSVVLATRKYVDDAVIEVKAYADGLMAAHLKASDPHTQYATKKSPVFTGTPKAPTPEAGNSSQMIATTEYIVDAIKSLNLGGAANRDVGTGKNQIPDMSSWTGSDIGGSVANGWRRTPDGYIEQWGLSSPTADTIQLLFPIPFPNKVMWISEHDNSGGTRKTFWQLNEVTNTGFAASNLGTVSKGVTTINAAVNARVNWFARGN